MTNPQQPHIMVSPPMGWNSWDCYGASVTEDEVRANASYMATHLKKYGWEYIVVDIQWYEPSADGSVYHPFVPLCMDAWGRLVPAENRFPSAKNGKGFQPLGEYIHSLGLLFGIHIMRGIPRQAVHQDTPIYGANHTARDIAHPYSICPWNTDMYGVNALAPGAQAYYDSIFQLYAQWGVDFIKVDDISYTSFGNDSYAGRHEVEMIHKAIQRCGRPMVLSLSCGPSPIEHAEHFQQHANLWRTTSDLWDRWCDIEKMFDKCHKWVSYAKPGHWPDADMLPLGHISIRGSEHGDTQRYTRLSQDEQQTMMTLWCVARSPLMMGGEMRDNDDFTLSLLTNRACLTVQQHGMNPHQLYRGGYNGQHIVWQTSDTDGIEYLAFFNTWNTASSIDFDLTDAGLTAYYTATDEWRMESLGIVHRNIILDIPSRGVRFISFKTVQPASQQVEV